MNTNEVDVIVNFAAESHVDRSITNSSEFVTTNILGTQILLEVAKKHSLRFIQISTDEVYGTLDQKVILLKILLYLLIVPILPVKQVLILS